MIAIDDVRAPATLPVEMTKTIRSLSPSINAIIGLGCALTFPALLFAETVEPKRPAAPSLKRGEKQLFVDSVMIREKQGITRVIHPAKKLDHPVLSAEMPWEWREAN